MSIVRLTSLPGNTFFRLSVPPYNAADAAVPVGIQGPFWPRIIDNPVGDNGGAFGDVGDARYLWYRNDVDPAKVATGETVFFARQVNLQFALSENSLITINVRIATDNAFQARLRVLLDGVVVLFDFFDGSISQNTIDSTSPFNWQKVYNFTRELFLLQTIGVLALQFEVKAVNYAQAGGSPLTNPAGVIYSIEIGGLAVVGGINKIENIPPNITNPLI